MRKSFFYLTLLAFSACSCQKDEPAIADMPLAQFAFLDEGVEKFADVAYHFINQSENASEYLWDFGDGTTSSEENLFHAYKQASTYRIMLTASQGNQADTTALTIVVKKNPFFLLCGDTCKTWKLAELYTSNAKETPDCFQDLTFIFCTDSSFRYAVAEIPGCFLEFGQQWEFQLAQDPDITSNGLAIQAGSGGNSKNYELHLSQDSLLLSQSDYHFYFVPE